MVRIQAAYDGLGHRQAALGPGIGKYCLLAAVFNDPAFCVGSRCYKIIGIGVFFCDFIAGCGRKTLR